MAAVSGFTGIVLSPQGHTNWRAWRLKESHGRAGETSPFLFSSFYQKRQDVQRKLNQAWRGGIQRHLISAVAANKLREPRKENVEGDLFVDHTCIDCDVCRWMAPSVYHRLNGQSAVYHQPQNSEERLQALQALVSCPTASIRTHKNPSDIVAAHATFPLPVDEEHLPGVYHCGFHSEKSYSATSYFIKRKGGNILVDSPRFSEVLAKRLEALGGVQYMFLTHRDDVADHEKWHDRFQCERILHNDEVSRWTAGVESKLQGAGPWSLDSDVQIIHTPGHTQGCISLLYGRALFSGDHLAFSSRLGGLTTFPSYNWHSVSEQIESVRLLLPLDFIWLLPGHGRRHKFASRAEKDDELNLLLQREGEVSTVRR